MGIPGLPPIKILIVDDSLFIRRLVSDFLNQDPELKVIDIARSGGEAIKKIPHLRPDCIILDLAMPGGDGLTTLQYIMDNFPTPVVILSAYSRENAEITLKCLEIGAVSFVLKPSGEISLDIERVQERLIQEVKAASKTKLKTVKSSLKSKPPPSPAPSRAKHKIAIIGASSGGLPSIEAIITALPQDFSLPILVIQHMPNRFFTDSLAVILSKKSSLNVKVANESELLRAPGVYLAPGGFNLRVESCVDHSHQQTRTRLTEAVADALTPSIDLAMESTADLFKEDSLGIILSGIGDDGLKGMAAIKAAGGRTIAQDESALVFGMPQAVIAAGLADKVLPAEDIAKELFMEGHS